MKRYRCQPIPFTLHPQVKQGSKRPCSVYQEISFEASTSLYCITFRNYYCSQVSVKQLVPHSDDPDEMEYHWVTVLDAKQLMASPHHEDDAQAYHTLTVHEFNDSFRPDKLTHLRIFLSQGSARWKRFGLQQLVCYRAVPITSTSTSPSSPSSILSTFTKIQQLT